MIGLVFGILWYVAVTTLSIMDPHPHLDKHRCYVDRAAFTKFCWPKNGCWLDAEGRATCWRVLKVQKGS